MARLTLCPQGLPAAPAAREACMAVLLRAGADAQRVIDGEGWSIERFAAHVARLKVLRGQYSSPLVVLTRTNPLALAVLQTRRVLEDAVPELERAPWLVYHDPAVDPFFESAVAGLGSVEDVDWPLAPIWYAPHAQRFLILGPHDKQLDIAAARVAALELAEVPESGAQQIRRGPMLAVSRGR
ncbi:MAG: hypothetical protein HS104_13445 [Polyangiaceae bacterium]|nr:hypothetical protein [Polyangiaceae bacterium]